MTPSPDSPNILPGFLPAMPLEREPPFSFSTFEMEESASVVAVGFSVPTVGVSVGFAVVGFGVATDGFVEGLVDVLGEVLNDGLVEVVGEEDVDGRSDEVGDELDTTVGDILGGLVTGDLVGGGFAVSFPGDVVFSGRLSGDSGDVPEGLFDVGGLGGLGPNENTGGPDSSSSAFAGGLGGRVGVLSDGGGLGGLGPKKNTGGPVSSSSPSPGVLVTLNESPSPGAVVVRFIGGGVGNFGPNENTGGLVGGSVGLGYVTSNERKRVNFVREREDLRDCHGEDSTSMRCPWGTYL